MSEFCDDTRIVCELPRMKRVHKRQGITVVCQRYGCDKIFKASYVSTMGDGWWEWEEVVPVKIEWPL